MPVSKYSKKVEIVDAIQYNGTNYEEVMTFASGAMTYENGVLTFNERGGQIIHKDWWIFKDFGGVYYAFGPNFLDYYKPGGGP